MRLTQSTAICLALILSLACREKTEHTAAGEVAISTAPPTRVELAMFAPLPRVMSAPGVTTTSVQVALGRKLFHEPLLSSGHDVSCNSCHGLNAYGADGRRVSFGDLGHAGDRNAPSVYNAAGQIAQFWDGRAATVEEQAKGPILNPGEMAMPDPAAVLAHLRASPEYVRAFAEAFPGEKQPITYDNVGHVIGAFERGLVTPSRWDRYLEGDSAALTPAEVRGFTTFTRLGCASCHAGPYVGGQSFQKLGRITPWPALKDSGRITVTHQPSDLYVFKVPSLRNVEKTGPYFHDGSVASLDSAILLMGRHQLGRELTTAQIASIRTWFGALTGELPAAYIASPPRPELRAP
ncbi:MAG TPA: cytochrome c peroxidase [Gemmatimonadaceae bacterium]